MFWRKLVDREFQRTPSVRLAAGLVMFGTLVDVLVTYFGNLEDPNRYGYWRDETPFGHYLYFFAAVLLVRAFFAAPGKDQADPIASVGPVEGKSPVQISASRSAKLPLLPLSTLLSLPRFSYLLAVFLSLLFLIFSSLLMQAWPRYGIWVHVVGGHLLLKSPSISEQALVVQVRVGKKMGTTETYLNGVAVDRVELVDQLRERLKRRSDWVVYVQGDDALAFKDVAEVMDLISGLHAKIVMLTTKLESARPKRIE